MTVNIIKIHLYIFRKVFEIQKLKEEVEQLKAEVSKIKKKLRLLGNSFNGNKVNQASSVAAEKEKQPKGESYNGYTISELKSSIRPTDPVAKVVDSIFKKLFTTDEIINCSITGKKVLKVETKGRVLHWTRTGLMSLWI